MANPEQGNQISITEFIFLGFRDLPKIQTLLFLLFLVIYIATRAGNVLIVALVVADQHLHTPMYFFLGNLSFLESCYTTTILPRMLAGLLTGDRTISFNGCLTQYYFFSSLLDTECLLLSVMSYYWYLAICNPLHYATSISCRTCLLLAGGSWIGGFLCIGILTFLITQLTFCGPNVIDHFFCNLIPLIKLSCNDPNLREMLAYPLTLIFLLIPFQLSLMSYVCVIATILKIPSTTGRQKAFSTCSSYLNVVSIYYGTLLIVYMFPTTDILSDFKKILSVVYADLTSLINPLIYSLRNKEVQEALRKACRKFMFGQWTFSKTIKQTSEVT